jgi:calcineurin-like phosphoesterase family protein
MTRQRRVFRTSDTHLGHLGEAVRRGFASRDEHDRAIIANWNMVVGPDDIVWHHGDVGVGREEEVLEMAAQLNGEQHLIAGNHDRCWPGHRNAHKHQRRWLEVFASVQPFARVSVDGQQVLASHLPYRGQGDSTDEERYSQYRFTDEGLPLLCGHVHREWKVSGRQINVGLDVWELRPVPMETLAIMIRQMDEGPDVTIDSAMTAH